jgi:WD40 repeat protein
VSDVVDPRGRVPRHVMAIVRLFALVLMPASTAIAGMLLHIESVSPRIGQRGTTVEVTIGGMCLGDPQEVVFYRPVQNGVAVLYDVTSGRRLAELGNEADTVIAADLSADELTVAIGGSTRVVKIFSTHDGELLHSLTKHTDWITAIAFSPDGKWLATGDRSGNIHLWDAASGGVVLPLSEHKAAVSALTWRSDSQLLASCGEDGLVVWWDVAKG